MANEQAHFAYDAARNIAGMNAAQPAAWPTGVSLLAQMVDACQRCDATDDCEDRVALPQFCANAAALKRTKS